MHMLEQVDWLAKYRAKLREVEKKQFVKDGRKTIKIRAVDPLKVRDKKKGVK